MLQGLPETLCAQLAEQMTLTEYVRRGVVAARGEVGPGLGFLLEGRLQGVDFTLDGREVGVYFVNEGECFGELPVVDGLPSSEYIIALSKSKVIHLPRVAARKLMLESPPIAEQVMMRLASRARMATEQRTLLSLPNPFQRLCAQLLQMHKAEGNNIANAPTHLELAIMVNTSRETVTRAFQFLQTNTIIQRDGASMLIENLAFLQDIAEGRKDSPKI